jgi:molybdopterin converting factor small subunit
MRVEFLGLSRERAGVSEFELQAETLGQALTTLALRFPAFGDVVAGDCLKPSFAANLNGDRFITDPRTRLGENDCLLILSADAGG